MLSYDQRGSNSLNYQLWTVEDKKPFNRRRLREALSPQGMKKEGKNYPVPPN